jgi:hypothetical protein
MSSRPEVGEEDGGGSGSDKQFGPEAEEIPDASNGSPLDVGQVADEIDQEDEIPVLEDENASEPDADIGSVGSSRKGKTQDDNRRLMEESASLDGTSSVPDDTPSVQVLSKRHKLLAPADHVRAPSCPQLTAVRNRFVPLGRAMALPPRDDHLTDVSNPVCRRHP